MKIYSVKKPEELNIVDFGRFFQMLEFIDSENKISYDNGRIIARNVLSKKLGFESTSGLDKFIHKLKKCRYLDRLEHFYINPLVARKEDFKWTKAIFDLFKEDIKSKMSKYEFMLLEKKIYNKGNIDDVFYLEDIPSDIMGIYRLYVNDALLYIGKSKNIKSRVYAHTKEKLIDSFDFISVENPSDINIFEVYLIDKYKPILNKDCKEKTHTQWLCTIILQIYNLHYQKGLVRLSLKRLMMVRYILHILMMELCLNKGI
jgi:hypothetical protein